MSTGIHKRRISRIVIFLLLTFGLSRGFWLLLALTIGHRAYLDLGLSPLDVLFPALVALILRLFVFRDSATRTAGVAYKRARAAFNLFAGRVKPPAVSNRG